MPLAAYEPTLNAIYAAAGDAAAWPSALGHVADFVGASGAIVVFNQLKGGRGFIITGRLRDDLGEVYISEYMHNPVTFGATRAAIGRATVASAFVDRTLLRRTAFHADILRPQGIDEQIILPHHSLQRGGHTGGIGLTLTSAQADQSETAARRLDRLASHLSSALDLALDIARHRDCGGQLATVLDALPTAAMFLDDLGRIVRSNGAAEAMLGEADGLSVAMSPRFRLAATLTEEDRKLQVFLMNALQVAEGGEDGFQPAIRIARPSTLAAYVVIATPLPPPTFRLLERLEPAARLLVRITDPADGAGHVRPAILQAAFDLTPAEARVASLVASGLSTPQAARALRLTPNTVRTHLARCFDKTGVRTQAGLSRLLAVWGDRR